MAEAVNRPVSAKGNAGSSKPPAGDMKPGNSRKSPAGTKASGERRRRRRRKRIVVNILQGVCFFAAMSLFIMLIVHIVQNYNPDITVQDFNAGAQTDDILTAPIDVQPFEEELAGNGSGAGDAFMDDDYAWYNDDVDAPDDESVGGVASSSAEILDGNLSGEGASLADIAVQYPGDDASDGHDSAATPSSEPVHAAQTSDVSASTAEVPDAGAADEQTISAAVSLPDLSDDALAAAGQSDSTYMSPTDEADSDAISPSAASGPVTITITATGDATLGFQTRADGYSNFKKAKDGFGVGYFLENFKDYFAEDDFTLVNLEGTLTSSTQKRPGRGFNFRGDPDYVGIMTGASIEVCNLGNNHALDYLKQGFLDTCSILDDNGIGYCGFTKEYYAQCKGYTVGFLGFNTWDHKVNDMIAEVSSAKQKCDLLIVSAHWGEEGDGTFSNETKKLGQAFVDAGADLVVGNHPHRIGAIMNYKGKYIIQVLGNFCFGGNDHPSEAARQTVVFRQRFLLSPDGSVSDGGIDLVPGFISGHSDFNDFQPCVANAKDGLNILKGVYSASKGAFKPDEVLWLDDSYVYEQGILENPRAAATPEVGQGTDAIEATPEVSQTPAGIAVSQS